MPGMRLTLMFLERLPVPVDLVEDSRQRCVLNDMGCVDERSGFMLGDPLARLCNQIVESLRRSSVLQFKSHDECEHPASLAYGLARLWNNFVPRPRRPVRRRWPTSGSSCSG